MAKKIERWDLDRVMTAVEKIEGAKDGSPFFWHGEITLTRGVDAGATSLEDVGTIILEFDPTTEEETIFFQPAD